MTLDMAAPRGARAVQIDAQAKLNLRLRILAREASGFHQLETLLLRVMLSDTVRVRRTAGARSLETTGADPEAIGPVEQNLAWRAATAYFAASGLSGGFAIEIEKRIPIGGGLGGGSADAGAVLRALDAMSNAPLGASHLLTLGATLGSDVPFLTGDAAYALAWGRGERMLALNPPPVRDVELLFPSFRVGTAEAYGWLAERAAQPAEAPQVLDVKSLSDWSGIARLARNDFEPVVAARHPIVAALLGTLRDSGSGNVIMMSGSGSTVFTVPVHGDASLGDRLPSGTIEPVRRVTTRTAMHVEPPRAIE